MSPGDRVYYKPDPAVGQWEEREPEPITVSEVQDWAATIALDRGDVIASAILADGWVQGKPVLLPSGAAATGPVRKRVRSAWSAAVIELDDEERRRRLRHIERTEGRL
jgi:hypothetical protein